MNRMGVDVGRRIRPIRKAETKSLGQIAYEAAAAATGCTQPWSEADQAKWEAAAQAVAVTTRKACAEIVKFPDGPTGGSMLTEWLRDERNKLAKAILAQGSAQLGDEAEGGH